MKSAICFFLCVLLAGCSMIYFFLPLSDLDTSVNSSGEVYVKDSQRNWIEFTKSIERSFQKELNGEEFWYRSIDSPNPPKTWPEATGYFIQRIRTGKPLLYENPDRRIEYIHRRRAELGLPPVTE